MQQPDASNFDQQLEQATSQRLRRLAAMPVDTSSLDKRLRLQIPAPATRHHGWLGRLRAVAAALVVAGAVVAAIALWSGGPVQASAAHMAQVHRDIIENRVPVMKVDSIAQASRMLATSSPAALPQAPDTHVMACCMKDIKNKKVACVLLRSEDSPITLSVASAADMKLPRGKPVMHNGIAYHVEKIDDLHMVSAQRDGRWVCLIGQVSAQRLMAIASRLEF
jgi:hypothetical protein